jgi:Bax protein
MASYLKQLGALIKPFLLLTLLLCFFWALLQPLVDEFLRASSETLVTAPIAVQAKPKRKPKPIIEKKIEPVLHTVVLPDFAAIRDVKEKKKQFFNYLRPTIQEENTRLTDLRKQLLLLIDKITWQQELSGAEQAQINRLVKKYRVNNNISQLQQVNELVKRIDIIPTALVLVQAANESAWGTSRFARVGLNFFGIWCYHKGCGMVPNARKVGANHEVAAFNSVTEAVQHYLYNINSNKAYQVFRNIRTQLRQQQQPLSAQVLATGLLAYSERGSAYVLEITQMIRQNQDYFQEAKAE